MWRFKRSKSKKWYWGLFEANIKWLVTINTWLSIPKDSREVINNKDKDLDSDLDLSQLKTNLILYPGTTSCLLKRDKRKLTIESRTKRMIMLSQTTHMSTEMSWVRVAPRGRKKISSRGLTDSKIWYCPLSREMDRRKREGHGVAIEDRPKNVEDWE